MSFSIVLEQLNVLEKQEITIVKFNTLHFITDAMATSTKCLLILTVKDYLLEMQSYYVAD